MSSRRCLLAGLVFTASLTPATGWAARSGAEDPTRIYNAPEISVTLTPVQGNGVASQSFSTTTQYVISVPAGQGTWASVRNRPQQFAIGSASNGVILDAIKGDITGASTYHYMGAVRQAPVFFCGWIMAQNLNPTGSTSNSFCPYSWDAPPQAFSQYINCENCNGGWAVTLKQPACLYRNVRPWDIPADPQQQAVCRPSGYQVYWRYVSEDGRWVSVADQGLTGNQWVFVSKDALPGICSAGARPPSDPGKADWGLVCG